MGEVRGPVSRRRQRFEDGLSLLYSVMIVHAEGGKKDGFNSMAKSGDSAGFTRRASNHSHQVDGCQDLTQLSVKPLIQEVQYIFLMYSRPHLAVSHSSIFMSGVAPGSSQVTISHNQHHTRSPPQTVLHYFEDPGSCAFTFPMFHPRARRNLTTLGKTAAVSGTRKTMRDL